MEDIGSFEYGYVVIGSEASEYTFYDVNTESVTWPLTVKLGFTTRKQDVLRISRSLSERDKVTNFREKGT